MLILIQGDICDYSHKYYMNLCRLLTFFLCDNIYFSILPLMFFLSSAIKSNLFLSLSLSYQKPTQTCKYKVFACCLTFFACINGFHQSLCFLRALSFSYHHYKFSICIRFKKYSSAIQYFYYNMCYSNNFSEY